MIVSLRKKSYQVILTAFLLVSFGVGLSIYSETRYARVEFSWLQYAERASKLDEMLTKLHRLIGYGGFIHHFKNLALRRDLPRYEQSIDENITSLRQTLAELSNVMEVQRDRETLEIIRRTFDEYSAKYHTLKQMVKAHNRPEEIDAYIAVDDTAALNALTELQLRIGERLISAKAETESLYTEAHQLMWISRIILVLSIVLAGVIILRYQKRLTLSLEEAESANNIIKAAGIGTWQVDVHNLEKGIWNDVCRQIHEVPEDYQISSSKGVTFFKEGKNRDTIKRVFSEALETGKPYDVELEFITYKNNERWIRTVGMPILKNDKVEKIYGLFQDITDRKLAELQYIKARDEAMRANKAKSEFLSSMSHELRTPLNAIIGFTQLLDMQNSLTDNQKEYVRLVNKAGHHLLSLINEVLDLAKIEAGKMVVSLEPVDLKAMSEECIFLVNSLASKRNINIHCHHLTDITVRADYVRLKQVLLNLLSNAVKYNHEGGRVTLSADTHNGLVRIKVADTGYGIEKDKLPEIFEAFNRLGQENSETEGTGIGLALTQRLVDLMGGSLGVESTPGEGSCFWIELPSDIKNAVEKKTASTELKSVQNADGIHKVLYIEDNPANLKLVESFFTEFNHLHLLTAHHPELGIEIAATQLPDLILLDINLPGMDGYKVLECLKQNKKTHHIPVIAITANAMPKDIERGKAAGFKEYLTKPLNLQQLNKFVNEALGTGK